MMGCEWGGGFGGYGLKGDESWRGGGTTRARGQRMRGGWMAGGVRMMGGAGVRRGGVKATAQAAANEICPAHARAVRWVQRRQQRAVRR